MAFWDSDEKKAKKAQAKLNSAPMYSIVGGVLFSVVFFLLLSKRSSPDGGDVSTGLMVFYGALATILLLYGFIRLLSKEKRISEVDCESKKSGSVLIDTNIDASRDDDEEDY